MKKIEPSIPTPTAAKKPKAKAPTVTLRDLATTLAETHEVPKKQVNAMLMGMVEDIAKHLKKGKRIRIAGLGILQVRKRPARMGRNPATGEAIKIKASKKIAFRASKELKGAI
jgi:DNA-binding protein HU-beta